MRQHFWYALFLIGLLLSNCTPTSTEEVITANQPTATPHLSLTETIIPLPTNTPPLTPPNTPRPTTTPTLTSSPTNTPRPTATPTSTIIPTLTAEEKEALLYDLFENNAGCLLPCWWGFIPGQTVWEDARTSLETLAFYISPLHHTPLDGVDVYFPDPYHIYRLEQIYGLENGVIRRIESDVLPVQRYSLATILVTYGQPSEVWLLSQSYVTPETGTLYFSVNLWYPSYGFILGYYQPNSSLSEDGIITSCLNEKIFINISIWDPDVVSSLNYMNVADQTRIFQPNGYELSLEEATGMTIETFYNNYRDASVTPCFTTPSNIWPGL